MFNTHFLISVDTGGTFSDCIAIDSNGNTHTCKILSNSSLRGSIIEWVDERTFYVQNSWLAHRDIFKGYRFRLLNHPLSNMTDFYIKNYDSNKKTIILNQPLPAECYGQKLAFDITADEEAPILAVRLITQTALDEPFPPLDLRLGTTRGTNALLEEKGAKTAFLTTEGFADILEIGTQQRPDLFALHIQKPKPLYTEGVEIEERLDAKGNILKPLNVNSLEYKITLLKKKKIESIALALMHSYRNPEQEQMVKKILEKHFDYISLSSELSQQIKFVPRAQTAVVNAYLAPILNDYLKKITQKLPSEALRVMTSAGNLIVSNFFMPKDSLLSGPAGGVVGAATIGQRSGFEQLITFDMGGTSTDVARYDGDFDYRFDVNIRNATVFSPALHIETVAAGGGSVCYFDGKKLCVGPESAGSSPGPACYGAGGPLTITDVNLLLGRLDAAQFGIPIFIEKAKEKLIDLQEIIKESGYNISEEKILNGFLVIANERMADAIRKISVAKGYAPPQYALLVFGGAGGLHACSMARLLDMKTILVPEHAGILSAYGILNAAIERFEEKQILKPVSEAHYTTLQQDFTNLTALARTKLIAEGVDKQHIQVKKQLIFCRLQGQDATIELDFEPDFTEKFREKYEKIYGHWVENRAIEVESIRVIAGERKENRNPLEINKQSDNSQTPPQYQPEFRHKIQALVGQNWQEVPVYFREDLRTGAMVQGFALLLDKYSTTVIEENFILKIDKYNTAIIQKANNDKTTNFKANQSNNNQTIDLELFTNRFMSLASNMGAMLQRTALSVNVKERLDFSCALLDKDGYLIANAPHIPVHLGSLGVCVREVLKVLKIEKGDTVVTNHPAFGGSHLPDVTLISACYTEGGQLIGYVANRCHHSEIGGIRPASMPPNATRLIEEGVIIEPMYLVKNNITDWESISYKLQFNTYPTRSLSENLADLNAALAANINGVMALQQMVAEHGLEKVHYYMSELKNYSAERLTLSLNRFKKMSDSPKFYTAEEQLDDGTLLKVKISIEDKIVFDFSGTSPVHKGNLNATPAIVNSVVIYVLRLLVAENIPLNEGFMQNVGLILPKNSILNPDFRENTEGYPAVVGGNVETSQRLTDTILKALKLLACGQGTMNNVLFGNHNFGYYETICGGSGAGDGFDGTDAVHTHMTNTRITDPEILEFRYPVRLDTFKIRKNSGGKGKFKGGNGIVRQLTFLDDVALSVLTQHRKVAPFGLNGGEAGKIGKQYLLLKNGKKKNLKGIDGANLTAGDTFVIETPGGGAANIIVNVIPN
ncbi:MAG: hydantoinase B/oxoprolinase family protein [Saprospiraceae bacterium]|nr:hydantoinase B/oxoprolinase family protein [Saprospiraceae bacterium]